MLVDVEAIRVLGTEIGLDAANREIHHGKFPGRGV